jgi:hypothetical protein
VLRLVFLFALVTLNHAIWMSERVVLMTQKSWSTTSSPTSSLAHPLPPLSEARILQDTQVQFTIALNVVQHDLKRRLVFVNLRSR